MRRILLLLASFALLASATAAEKQEAPEKKKKAKTEEKNADGQTIKKGWNVAPFPSVGFNSDTGFQIGALVELFDYGDGKEFPSYRHKLHIEGFYTTGGQATAHFFYDSKYLIPNVRLTAAATYSLNTMYPFLGFNGAASPYNPAYASGKKQEHRVSMYNMRRHMMRVLLDFQGNIATSKFRWAAGVSYWWYELGDITLRKYDVACDENGETTNHYLKENDIHSSTLWQLYRRAGLIKAEEATGGHHIELKAGLVYDSREHEADPSRGIWAELYAFGSPDIVQGRNHYLKLAAHFRHYVPVWRDRITFAYHLAYQGRVAGNAPYYSLQNINTLYLRQIVSDGLGSLNTVRGVRYNSVVGDGYAWANVEMRFKLVSFKFIKQNWYLATNPFFDMGACVQPYRFAEMKQIRETGRSLDGTQQFTNSELDLIYQGGKEKLHMSAGLGVKLAMNRNFILSAEFAFPLNRKQDGNFGTNIGLNYIF